MLYFFMKIQQYTNIRKVLNMIQNENSSSDLNDSLDDNLNINLVDDLKNNLIDNLNNNLADNLNGNLKQAYQVLQKYFGYSYFREGQEELIQSILEKRDTLGIMPTGAGKSICYQVPALAMDGITIVISPLISLMKDQVAALNEAGIHAAYINSSLSTKQVSLALQYAKQGRYQIIYVAPERLSTEEFLDFALQSNITMVTIDEAHCISQWGQDFRPSYLNIVDFIEQLPKRPIVSAFTATATKEVMEDIICVLRLEEPTIVVTGYDRPNLFYEVRTPKDKDAELIEYIKNHNSWCGIIYCSTRKNVEEVQELLRKNGIDAAKYHGGMNDDQRNENQEDFIYDRKLVMVATNAFGMGIDKSNVRYVIHYNMPKNIESYYQEAGRAGRDGEASECILFYAPMDVRINQFLIENGNENEMLTEDQKEMIRERDEERLKMMTYYCFTKDCLREYILRYFGQYTEANCDNCSNCLAEFEEVDVTNLSQDIIGCIRECRERFGLNVIISTLQGRKIAKLTANRMNESSFYGKHQMESESFLKSVMNKLIIDGYLYLTSDKYAIVKVNRSANEIEMGTTKVILKTSKESQNQGKINSSKKLKKSELLTSKGFELFEILRQVRTKIAREEGMPPYIIFSDKTLTDMVIKLPFNKDEMLFVTGVGENKFEKYGQAFLDAILEFTGGVKERLCYEDQEVLELSKKSSSNRSSAKTGKEDFSLTEEIRENIKFEELVTISQFVDQLNELRDDKRMKQINTKHFTTLLKEKEYLYERYDEELQKNVIEVTEKGYSVGITMDKRVGRGGFEYNVISYNKEAQQILLELIS